MPNTFSPTPAPLTPLPFATREPELVAVEWVDLEIAASSETVTASANPNAATTAQTPVITTDAPSTRASKPTDIAENSSPAAAVEPFARPARNQPPGTARTNTAPAPTAPAAPSVNSAGARASSLRTNTATEQRVILEFRDASGAAYRVISQPETWLALGTELLPGWRHANLAGTDRQEIPTLTALPGNARPATDTAGENPAGSENSEPHQFTRDSRGDLAEMLALPSNARGPETAVHPAFTASSHLPPTNDPTARAADSPPKNERAEKITAPATEHPGLGTTVAPQRVIMNMADAGNQSAPRSEKTLPLVMGFAGTADSPALPGQWKIRRESRPFATTAITTDPTLAPWAARAPSDPRDLQLAAAPLLPEPPRVAMEKVHQLISREINLVRQLGADALAIVLKPDSRTELFLQISHRDGKTEALIRCERGDFEHLQQNWTQLQSTLASQQVTLAPLQRATLAAQETTERSTTSGNASFSSSTDTGTGQHPQRQPDPTPRSLDELPLVGSLTEPFKRRTTSRATTPTTAGAMALATNKTGLERWA